MMDINVNVGLLELINVPNILFLVYSNEDESERIIKFVYWVGKHCTARSIFFSLEDIKPIWYCIRSIAHCTFLFVIYMYVYNLVLYTLHIRSVSITSTSRVAFPNRLGT